MRTQHRYARNKENENFRIRRAYTALYDDKADMSLHVQMSLHYGSDLPISQPVLLFLKQSKFC